MEETRGDRPQENQSENYDEWKERYAKGSQNPRELFQQVSRIAQYMSYDLIDKLRYWEKETLEMSDDDIEKRLGHMAVFLERLKKAYVDFAETDL